MPAFSRSQISDSRLSAAARSLYFSTFSVIVFGNVEVKTYDLRYDASVVARTWPSIPSSDKPILHLGFGTPGLITLMKRLPGDKVPMLMSTAKVGLVWQPNGRHFSFRPTAAGFVDQVLLGAVARCGSARFRDVKHYKRRKALAGLGQTGQQGITKKSSPSCCSEPPLPTNADNPAGDRQWQSIATPQTSIRQGRAGVQSVLPTSWRRVSA